MKPRLLIAIGLLAYAPAAFAQKNPKMVPAEFIQTLSLTPFMTKGDPDIWVGELAPAIAAHVSLPPNSRIIGSVDYHEVVTGAIASEQTPDGARESIGAALVKKGWRRAQPLRQPGNGGFTEQDETTGDNIYCSPDSVALNIAPMKDRDGKTRVLLILLPSSNYPTCNPNYKPFTPGQRPQSVIPNLQPMPGSNVVGAGSGGGGNEWYSEAQIRTTSSVNDVAKYYVNQLVAAGWKAERTVSVEGVSTTTFRFEKDGERWTARLLTMAQEGRYPIYMKIRAAGPNTDPF